MWNLRSPTRYRTHTHYLERQGPNCWTTREVPLLYFLIALINMLSNLTGFLVECLLALKQGQELCLSLP